MTSMTKLGLTEVSSVSRAISNARSHLKVPSLNYSDVRFCVDRFQRLFRNTIDVMRNPLQLEVVSRIFLGRVERPIRIEEAGDSSVHPWSRRMTTFSGWNTSRDFWRFARTGIASWHLNFKLA